MTVRAKFRCMEENRSVQAGDARTYKFMAMYDQDTPEDQRYAKYTPSGSLAITVDNPRVEFELGAYYYLDITKVDETAEQS